MSEELPEGWTEARLPQLADIIMGQSPPGSTYNDAGKGLPFFQGKAEFGPRNPVVRKWCVAPQKLAEPGDVLISVRAPVGPTNVASVRCAIGRGLSALRPRGGIPSEFVLFALRAQEQAIALRGTGSTFTAISSSDLAAVAIAVPPLAEQRRIVETVEALLTQVNAAADSLAQVSLILRRFRQSVFAAACSGKLTADWRNDPEPRSGAAGTVDGLFELPVEWTWRPFRDLLASIRSGSTAVPQLGVTPFPILRSSSVRRGVVDLQDVRYLRADQSESDANYISEGDLLFTRLSGSLDFVGNCARVPTLRGLRVQYPDRLFCGKLKEPREGEFFELVFRAPFIQKVLSELAKSSAGHQRISMGAITDILVPYPSPGEQDEIVRRVKGILAMAETIERRVVTSSARADALTHSILAKAFRGELVPIEAELARAEGRDYESAEALLARIHSKGAARVPTPKPRKTTSGAAS